MKSSKRRFARGLAALFAVTGTPGIASTALSQGWPGKPITLVVAFPPGGDTDTVARLYAEKLSAALETPVIVDNRPGAGGLIGHAQAARARPDGNTLVWAPSPLVIAQHVLKVSPGSTFDPVGDFTPIIQDDDIPLVLVTSPARGFKDVAELVAAAKQDASLTYATPGAGSPMHVVGEMLNRAAGIKLVHVPYKGSAPVVADALGNHFTVGWTTSGAVMHHIESGKLVALATASPQRLKSLPSTPTLIEAGYDIKLTAWQGLLGPKGLPQDVVTTLNRLMNNILVMPEVVSHLRSMGIEPVGGTPEDFARRIAGDNALYGRLVREFNIRVE